jgi:phosphomannomutase
MPHYSRTLREAILREVTSDLKDEEQSEVTLPLAGLRIVLNAGNGSGGFFYEVLRELGADVSASLHLISDGDFPAGVPNPEYAPMIEETRRACEEANADLGIMLDTDADRSGFIAPRHVAADGTCLQYEELNRNRLIALLAVVFAKSSPGCSVVTDSVTSEGLSAFLQDKLGLQHVRYLKGYANCISKAQELTTSGAANAEMAIETSGHCAMKENDYLDDGTYTAVKVIGMLAREAHSRRHGGEHRSLLDLISELDEMPEEQELRMNVLDGTLQSTSAVFDFCALEIEQSCENGETAAISRWSLDRENLEGIRVRTGDGGYFMLRKSLHDPIISLQVEGKSRDDVLSTVVQPLIGLFRSQPQIGTSLDLSALESY